MTHTTDYATQRGLPTWALTLFAAVAILVTLLAGLAGGYVSRNGEVRDGEQALSESRNETKLAEAEVEAVKADAEEARADAEDAEDDLAALESQVTSCEAALVDLDKDVSALLDSITAATNNNYLSAIEYLDQVTIRESQDAKSCRGAGGLNA